MIVSDLSDWEYVHSRIRNSRCPLTGDPLFACDTETLDYGYPDISITGISFGWYSGNQEETAYVPINHNTDHPQLDLDDIREDLIDSVFAERRTVLFHNAKYDLNVFRLEDIPIRASIYDTMIAAFLLDTCGAGSHKARIWDKGRWGLDVLVKHVFDYEMTSLKDICDDALKYPEYPDIDEKVLLTHEVDVETMAEYAREDVYWPLKLRHHEFDKFETEPRIHKIFDRIETPFIRVLADLEHWGIEIEADTLEEIKVGLREELDGLMEKMFDSRPGQDFSPVDPEIVQEAIDQFAELERRFDHDKDHKEYPDHSEYEDSAKDNGPVGKGWARNRMFENLGIKDTLLEDKIRDAFDKSTPLEEWMYEWPHLAHKIFNPNSQKDLNKVFFEEADLIPYGEKNERGLWPTKARFVEKWADKHEVAENLTRIRLLTKLHDTYAKGILARIAEDGRLRTRLNRLVRTGRLSSRDPNLQNQPKEKDYPIRRAFVATGVSDSSVEVHEKDDQGYIVHSTVEGSGGGYEVNDGTLVRWWGDNPPWVLGVADYSQLEIRILAHYSQDETLIQTLLDGIDVHGKTAKLMYPDEIPDDVHPNDVKQEYPKWRDKVKAVEFGTVYGIGPNKLARQLGISKESAEEMIEKFNHEIYPGIGEYIENQHEFVRENGYVRTWMGRKRHIPLALVADPYQDKKALWRAQRIAQNSPIQGTAADIINTAMVNIRDYCRSNSPLDVMDISDFAKPENDFNGDMDFASPLYGEWMRVLLQVHDELIFEFHPSVAEWGLNQMNDLMTDALSLRLPLEVDAALGWNWHDTKE